MVMVFRKAQEPENSQVKSAALTKLGFCCRLLTCEVIWLESVSLERYCCPCLGRCVGSNVNFSGAFLRAKPNATGGCCWGRRI